MTRFAFRVRPGGACFARSSGGGRCDLGVIICARSGQRVGFRDFANGTNEMADDAHAEPRRTEGHGRL